MHRELFYCEKTQKGYEEVYKIFKNENIPFNLEWITWQLSDDRFFTKEQAFDLLYYFINKYCDDGGKLELFKNENLELNKEG